MVISEEQWNLFQRDIATRVKEPLPTLAVPSISQMRRPLVAFAQHLENESLRKLNKLPGIIYDIDVHVAHISFGYNNAALLALLTKRG